MISYTFNSTTISILCMFTLNLNLMKYEINQFMHPSICLFICNILLSIDKVRNTASKELIGQVE